MRTRGWLRGIVVASSIRRGRRRFYIVLIVSVEFVPLSHVRIVGCYIRDDGVVDQSGM